MAVMLKGFDLQVYLGRRPAGAAPFPATCTAGTTRTTPGIQFTYTPFAALLFAAGSVLPFHALVALVAAVSTVALTATIWIAFRELGWQPMGTGRGRRLLLTGLVFWTEPVQRALFLGQVEAGAGWRSWCGTCASRTAAGGRARPPGLAAAIKLVPLLFIVYLVLTRRFRQAAVAIAVFAGTVIIGFRGAARPVQILVDRRQTSSRRAVPGSSAPSRTSRCAGC